MGPRRPDLAELLGGQGASPEELEGLDAAAPTGAGPGIGDTSVLSDEDLAAMAEGAAGMGEIGGGESIPVLQNEADQPGLDPMSQMDIQQRLALAARRRLAGV